MTFAYTDGQSIEENILRIIREAGELSADCSIASEQYAHWPVRYHLSSVRSNVIRHLDFSGLDVIELGAGMGAMSRYLAEHAKSLVSVEGSPRRFEALRERLRDCPNWSGITANVQDLAIEQKFDVVCVFGVLEYAELYIQPLADFEGNSFDYFLHVATSLLKDDGVLVLTIENQLGLKYWSGAAEDHTALLFDSITGYGNSKSVRTFSRKGIRQLATRAGLPCCETYMAFPDYKLTSCVISERLPAIAPGLAAELAAMRPFENYGNPRNVLFPERLALHSVSEAGLLPEFSNSFLMIAGRTDQSPTLAHVKALDRNQNTLAWHYAADRTVATCTQFLQDAGASAIQVQKRAMHSSAPTEPTTIANDELSLGWSPGSDTTASLSPILYTLLFRSVYQQDWGDFTSRLSAFIGWSLTHWKQSSDDGRVVLRGNSIDAVHTNAAVTGDTYHLFDLEWTLDGGMPASWFVLRNVLMFAYRHDLEFFTASAPFGSLSGLYQTLCGEHSLTADFDADIAKERELQRLTAVRFVDEGYSQFVSAVSRPFTQANVPREPLPLHQQLHNFEAMRAEWYSRPVVLARKLQEFSTRHPAASNVLRTLTRPLRGSPESPQS